MLTPIFITRVHGADMRLASSSIRPGAPAPTRSAPQSITAKVVALKLSSLWSRQVQPCRSPIDMQTDAAAIWPNTPDDRRHLKNPDRQFLESKGPEVTNVSPRFRHLHNQAVARQRGLPLLGMIPHGKNRSGRPSSASPSTRPPAADRVSG